MRKQRLIIFYIVQIPGNNCKYYLMVLNAKTAHVTTGVALYCLYLLIILCILVVYAYTCLHMFSKQIIFKQLLPIYKIRCM